MTGHHWGPKRKLGSGYRAPSLHRMSYLSVGLLCEASSNFHRRVWYHVLSLRYVCIMHVLNVRASSSPLSYPCAKFRFCRSLHFWASPWTKIASQSLTHSVSQYLTQLIWFAGNRSNNTNLYRISHCFQVITTYRSNYHFWRRYLYLAPSFGVNLWIWTAKLDLKKTRLITLSCAAQNILIY